MKKTLIIIGIVLSFNACAQTWQQLYNKQTTNLNRLDSLYSLLQIENDSLNNVVNLSCDSLQYYKDLSKYWELNYKEISPYGKDGYNVKLYYADSLGIEYTLTNLNNLTWLKSEYNGKQFNVWINTNDIRIWYVYPNTDSIQITQLLVRYNLDWFNNK